jgi:hypothetical protein
MVGRTEAEAPFSVAMIEASLVLLRTKAGKVHRAVRFEGNSELMTYEADNLDLADVEELPDISDVDDPSAFCERCFGPLDRGEFDSPIGSTPV